MAFVGRAAAVLVLLAMLAPFVYAVWMSFAPGEILEPPTDRWSLRWYREFLGSARWTAALRTTAEVAAVSAVVSLLGGLGVALAVARYHFRGRAMLSAAVLLPMFVPAVVLGMGLLPLVRGVGLWGTTLSIAAAHSLVSLPVVFLLLRSALEAVDPDLERAARGLGAGPMTAFRRVTLPLISPSILAGMVIAVVLSVNEFTLALFLGSPRLRTLPAALWPEARDKETPLLAAASCLSVLVTLVSLGIAARVLRRDEVHKSA
ncbi:Molybdenum transport system permease protein ModB [Fimbriiglobus ruber]|uniref:Molybdenum transport system permease protein ModB n=1 Tax=Fimbriiglobus ruber TaxID=1908690 RepID=A0A225DZE4_9BACT|nr:Molybdenum transport system permease protein ModB [Fimbriiglobus ruber]